MCNIGPIPSLYSLMSYPESSGPMVGIELEVPLSWDYWNRKVRRHPPPGKCCQSLEDVEWNRRGISLLGLKNGWIHRSLCQSGETRLPSCKKLQDWYLAEWEAEDILSEGESPYDKDRACHSTGFPYKSDRLPLLNR